MPMSTFKIEGGNTLKGDLEPQGAKNEALQVICATLLSSDVTFIENIPEIRDVLKLIEILEGLGVKVERLAKGHYSFDASSINVDFLKSPEYAQQAVGLRGSIMIIGPLLARFGQGFIPQPGGDKIGRRRVDTHFIGLQKAWRRVYLRQGKSLVSCFSRKTERRIYVARRSFGYRYGKYFNGCCSCRRNNNNLQCCLRTLLATVM